MYFLKFLYQSKIPLNVYKSILIRQHLLNAKTNNSFKLRLKTFLSVLALLYRIASRIKKTKAQYLIIDSFVAPNHIDLRKEFVTYFNDDIELEDLVLGNHQHFFYQKLSFSIICGMRCHLAQISDCCFFEFICETEISNKRLLLRCS